jgi:ATP-dependent Clp protease ATP-binding subunit ClpB
MRQEEASTKPLERYAQDAKGLVVAAQALADDRKHAEVLPLHLLGRGLGSDPGVAEVMRRAGVDVVSMQAAVEQALSALPRSREPAYLSVAMLDLLERAEREADRDRTREVGTEHLLNALSQEIRGPAGEILGAYRVAPGSLRPHMAALRSLPRPTGGSGEPVSEAAVRDLVDEARRGAFDPVIGRQAEVRRLVTILERRQKCHPLLVGEPGVGKGAVVRALALRILRGDVPTSLGAARLYEINVGALVAGARLRGEIEDRLKKLLAGLGSGHQESILVVRGFDQLLGQGPTGAAVGEVFAPVLGRGEVHLVGTTTPEGLRKLGDRDPMLVRLFTVLEVGQPSVDQAIEILRGIAARYEAHHQVEISESAIVAAVRLAKRYLQDRFLPDSAVDLLDESAASRRVELDGVPADLEQGTGRVESLRAQLESLTHADDRPTVDSRTRISGELGELEPKVARLRAELESRRNLVAAVRTLGSELEARRAECEQARADQNFARLGELEHVTLPELEVRLGKARAAAESAGAAVEGRVLTESDVAQTLALWTGIPVHKMLEGEADKLLKMEARLGARVVGQEAAVGAVARAVRRGRVGLRDPGKPIGSFLFLGPSGVGKTELGKALAEFLFDDEQALTRLDMSEFMERHMAQRLIGAPPGYADSEQGGFLTEAVRRRPYSVLLFDEVEKAHQDVFNLLLQVLDDGRLTDGRGRSADFSNTVVIMTSNTGSGRILETDPRLFEKPEGREALRDVLLDELKRFFRPEFLNRIDDVVVFRPLDKEDLGRIVDIQLVRLGRLLGDRQVRVVLEEAAKARLIALGYEPALGARPLRRAILREIQDPLAQALLDGTCRDGDTLTVGMDGEKFVFRKDQTGP